MRRAVLLALALLTPLGCAGPARRGTLACYTPGQPLEESKAADGATYGLYASYQAPGAVPLFQTAAADGMAVGFRRDIDGVVMAVAGHQAVPAPDCECEWRVVPGTGLTRGDKVREKAADASKTVGSVLLIGGILFVAGGLAALYAVGKSNSGVR